MAESAGAKKLNIEDENVRQEELCRLREENRDLQSAREKLVKKLEKKKNELENEKTNSTTFRQLIQELNRKVETLERERGTLPVMNPPRIDPGTALSEEVVERLVVEKTRLESTVVEQRTEIETLTSEISSMESRLDLANQNLEISRGEIDRFEKLAPELKLDLSKMENECQLMSESTNCDKARLNDRTTETETLKTKIQDLSTTNKHYLSQLQLKDYTISRTTSKFETEKQQILEQSRLEIEQVKENETSLQEQLTRAREGLEELARQSRDNERTDQDILALSTKNDQLIQQVANLQEDNAKLQEEFAKPSKLIAQLVVTQDKVTDLLRKCNSLEKAKNEIEDTLRTELDEAIDQISLLETETNEQRQRIDAQNEMLETYKQQQSLEKENRNSLLIKDKQIALLEMLNLTLEASKKNCETRIKEQNESLQQSKHDFYEIDDRIKQSEIEFLERCATLADEKSVLEVQMDVLNVQIVVLSEEKEGWQRQVAEFKSQISELSREKNKWQRQVAELQKNGDGDKHSETKDKQISHLKLINLELEASKKTCDTHILELNDELQQCKSDYDDLDERRKQSERLREDLERTIEEILHGIPDRDKLTKRRIMKSLSTPAMPANPKLTKDKGKEVDSKHSEGATNMDLTPELIAQPNNSGKTPSRIIFRGGCIHVVKLKAFPNVMECISKQVICSINKRYELGILIIIVDLATKVGLRNPVSKHAGIRLYNPVGNCDGVYKSERYFNCPPNCGICVPLEDVYVPVP